MGKRADRAMERYAGGEDAAFEELYATLAPRVLEYLRVRVSEKTAAEELTLRTFVLIGEARASYIAGAEVAPWALAIAERLAASYDARARRTSWWREVTRNLRRS